jgi:ATP phosphoribosyltransferase regulatory subunit
MSPEAARQAIRDVLDTVGATWVTPSVVQPAGIYLELYGEQIRRRIFLIESGSEEMCLRPDLTAPAVRAAFALPKLPAFVAYDGLVFRRQLESTARETEFGQVGAEWLGQGGFDVGAEAEIISIALRGAASASSKMRLGDVAVLRAFVDALGLADPWPNRLMRALARTGGLAALRAEPPPALDDQGAGLAEALAAMPADHAEAAVADLLNLARITSVGGRPLSEIAQRLRQRGALAAATPPTPAQYDLLDALTRIDAADGLAQTEKLASSKALAKPEIAQAAIANAKARSDALAGVLPKDFAFAPGLGRSVSYYDGFVFELEAPALGDRASLGGGGRYDGLARALWPAGKPVPVSLRAAGFALRPQRIAEAAR